LYQCHVFVVFPDHCDCIANLHFLVWVAEQVAYHTDVASIGKLDQNNQIGSAVFQCFVDWVPDSLESIDLAAARALVPTKLIRTAIIADPFRAKLKGPTGVAALHKQSVVSRAFPEGSIEAIR
jgi:hypothetical protein